MTSPLENLAGTGKPLVEEPIPDDESLMCAMDEENFAARFIAEQLS